MATIPGIDAYVQKPGVLIGDAILAGRKVALQKRAQEADENRQKSQADNERIRQAENVRDYELRKQQGEAEAQYRRDALKQQDAIRQRQEAIAQAKQNEERALLEQQRQNQMAEALALQEALSGEPNTQADHNLRSTPGWASGAAKGAQSRAEIESREKIAGIRSAKTEKPTFTPGIQVIGGIPIRVDSKGGEHSLTETEHRAWLNANKAKKEADELVNASKMVDSSQVVAKAYRDKKTGEMKLEKKQK